MNRIALPLACLALVASPALHAVDKPVAPVPRAAPVAEPAAPLTPVELARARELRELVETSQKMLAAFARDDAAGESTLPRAERERRVNDLADRYEVLLKQAPDDLGTLLLFGKYLRAIGYRDRAFEVFSRADRLDRTLAVVKHQLGAHHAEEGDFARALPLLLETTTLEPGVARYRYDFAEFLSAAGDRLAADGTLPRESRDRIMLENFAEAARLAPNEAGYRWRHAEAFHEVRKPDPAKALAAWDALSLGAKGDLEREVIGLHRARWLIALNRSEEARALIFASKTPALDATRRQLLDRLLTQEPGLRSPFTHDDPARPVVAPEVKK